MIRKGNISTVDNVMKKARVIIYELNSKISSELTIAHYVGEVKVNDVVVVSFYNDDISDGVIIANLSNNIGSGQIGSNNTYTHTQLSPVNVWNIKHDLNKFPSITVVDSAGSLIVGDPTYISENEIKISFTGAFSGKAYLN